MEACATIRRENEGIAGVVQFTCHYESSVLRDLLYQRTLNTVCELDDDLAADTNRTTSSRQERQVQLPQEIIVGSFRVFDLLFHFKQRCIYRL
jgi:hypothetical protein